MNKKNLFFAKVGNTKIIPIGIKILVIFIFIILLSNFTTNFISLQLSQKKLINLNNTIMVEQLKELYTNSSNQFQIYSYSNNLEKSIEDLTSAAKAGFSNPNSLALAVSSTGNIKFFACNNGLPQWETFPDEQLLNKLNEQLKLGTGEGTVIFKDPFDNEYFGVYKFQKDWSYYIIRAEMRSDTKQNIYHVYFLTSILIFTFTILFIIIGQLVLKQEFKTLRTFTSDLIEMQKSKQLSLIDLSNATNDDVSYMAASFNSLSSSVNNLLGIFQKFVPKDVVQKAYSNQGVSLEGSQKELTMLFSDIKSFTYRTETLGNDIIDVLNVHYNRVIHSVHKENGVIGSIIGDAILAVFGTMNSEHSKSYDAIISAWDITKVTAALRTAMIKRREQIEKTRSLTESEERVYKAVLIDVGVGIDGGNVFYGNIGSNEHMANTVIGDNVNSASRLEGLTRIYHLPVIVSDYIKNEVENETNRFKFIEIDTVQVKGKTEGKKIYFPLDSLDIDESVLVKFGEYSQALKFYYEGDWNSARSLFKKCELNAAEVFLERMGQKKAPENWSGIWTMTTK